MANELGFVQSLVARACLLWLAAVPALGCDAAGAGRRAPGGPDDGVRRGDAREDPPRAGRVRELLAGTEAGRRLLERTGPPPSIRFVAAPDPVLLADGTILLDPYATDAENAARLGHLLRHAVDGAILPPGPDAAATAEPWTDHRLELEAPAILLEIELRVALGVDHPRRSYPFESEIRAAPPADRLRLLRSWLERMMPSTR
ncbi:MAG: hypothetical protein HY905_16130 [Deltaproteobacteria bacterium]|nr:hypothetical protein [Deltaproteobacteria bacterium]